MSQDRESGAKASQYGHDCGQKIIEAIGAKSVKAGSNECLLNGDLLTVHCARKDTDSVGVTYKTLERISAVLGAFEQADGSYAVRRMPKEQYKKLMKETRNLGASRKKVGIVKRADFDTCPLIANVPAF